MKMKCVDNEPSQSLTIGKKYKILKKIKGVYDTAVLVINDNGREEYYSIDRFEYCGLLGLLY